MQKIPRKDLEIALKKLNNYPAVALLGARQIGKSTLAKELITKKKRGYLLRLRA